MTGSRWQSAILDAVRGEGRATIAGLAESLQVSGETIRRHVRPLGVGRGRALADRMAFVAPGMLQHLAGFAKPRARARGFGLGDAGRRPRDGRQRREQRAAAQRS